MEIPCGRMLKCTKGSPLYTRTVVEDKTQLNDIQDGWYAIMTLESSEVKCRVKLYDVVDVYFTKYAPFQRPINDENTLRGYISSL